MESATREVRWHDTEKAVEITKWKALVERTIWKGIQTIRIIPEITEERRSY